MKTIGNRLKSTDWSVLYRMENTDLANSFLTEQIQMALDNTAPRKLVQHRRQYRSWISDRTKLVMEQRNLARDKARRSQLDTDWHDFRVLRNSCTKLQSQEKKLHESNTFDEIIASKDTKRLFTKTRKLLNWRSGGPPKRFLQDGKSYQKAADIARIQMEYYVKKLMQIKCALGTTNRDPLRLLKSAFKRWKPDRIIPDFHFKQISLIETVSMIKQLKNSTAHGVDNIDTMAIKLAAETLYEPIRHVINLSLTNGIFPMKWKLGKLKPLLKNFEIDPLIPNSYRPICLLPTLSKLTEKAAQLQLLGHLENTDQIHRDHHAYRSKLNTTSALLQITDMLYKTTDKNRITSSMTMDMTAAFDTVRHDLLLLKLPYYKVSPPAIKWIRSYLESRSNFVEIGDKSSAITPVECGVPQGSCLGPLLYLIFVNELPESIRGEDLCQNPAHSDTKSLFGMECPDCGVMPIFADDGICLLAGNNRAANQTKMENKFRCIKEFLTDNGLVVNDGNTSLTEFMAQQKRGKIKGKPPTLVVQVMVYGRVIDKTIEDSKCSRFFGATLQNNHSWQNHLVVGKKAVFPGIKKQLGALYFLRDMLPLKGRLLLANSFVIGKLVYLLPLWGSATMNYIQKGQSVLNWAARFVTKAHRRTRTSDLMRMCGWLCLSDMILFQSMLQLWKILKWKTPIALHKEYVIGNDWSISTSIPRLQLTAASYKWRVVAPWNDLPQRLRNLDKISIFKKQLRKEITEKRQETVQRRITERRLENERRRDALMRQPPAPD